MELPPYRIPTVRSVVKHVSFRTGLYFRKIGGVILLASIIVWFLSNYPRSNINITNINGEISKVENSELPAGQKAGMIDNLHSEQRIEIQKDSFMGMIGRAIEPVMKPLGFDWRLSVSILSGVAAKEVVVSTLGVLFQADSSHESTSLVEKIQTQTNEAGGKLFSPLMAFSFMLFILTYFPCIGVISAIKKESGSWKWAAFIVVYTTSIAWLLSFSVYQLGSIFF